MCKVYFFHYLMQTHPMYAILKKNDRKLLLKERYTYAISKKMPSLQRKNG